MADTNYDDIIKFIFDDVEIMSDVSMHGYISDEYVKELKELIT